MKIRRTVKTPVGRKNIEKSEIDFAMYFLRLVKQDLSFRIYFSEDGKKLTYEIEKPKKINKKIKIRNNYTSNKESLEEARKAYIYNNRIRREDKKGDVS